MSSRGTRGNCPRCPPLIRPWSRPVSAVLNLMAVHPTQHCSILEISFCFGTLNALHFDKSLHLCFTADFSIAYIFKYFVKIKVTLRNWKKRMKKMRGWTCESQTFHASQRKILWSVRTKICFLFFVTKLFRVVFRQWRNWQGAGVRAAPPPGRLNVRNGPRVSSYFGI